jgi:hypothetical protein
MRLASSLHFCIHCSLTVANSHYILCIKNFNIGRNEQYGNENINGVKNFLLVLFGNFFLNAKRAGHLINIKQYKDSENNKNGDHQ